MTTTEQQNIKAQQDLLSFPEAQGLNFKLVIQMNAIILLAVIIVGVGLQAL